MATRPTGSDIRIYCAQKLQRRWPKNKQEKRAHAYYIIHLRSVCAVGIKHHWLHSHRLVQHLQSVVPMLLAQEKNTCLKHLDYRSIVQLQFNLRTPMDLSNICFYDGLLMWHSGGNVKSNTCVNRIIAHIGSASCGISHNLIFLVIMHL